VNDLSSSLLSKNINIKIYRTITWPVVLNGCETWSLTLREEHRLRVFENRMLRKIFGPKREDISGEWRKLHNEELNVLYSSPPTIRMINSRRIRCVRHVVHMGREVYTGFWWGNLKARDHLEGPGVDERIILKWIFKTWDGDHGLG
jgi:hypothetical protein